MTKGDSIGTLARKAGVNANTIRYYEAEGLLPPAPRSGSGYRQYGEPELARLRFIRKAQGVGFSLAEIRGLLSTRADGEPACEPVARLIEAKIDELDRRLAELQAFRQELVRLRHRMKTEPMPEGAICGFIETFRTEDADGDRA